jgi:CubicO group peptidase (beta-lactamase class C family)
VLKMPVLSRISLATLALTIATVTACGPPAATAQRPVDAIGTEVDRFIASLEEPFSGVILIAAGDEILVNRGYGEAERRFAIPNAPDTSFRIGSISKQFTAVIALRLAELEIVDLDAPVGKYVPEFSAQAGRITLNELLSHTSGIAHHFNAIPEYFGRFDQLFHTPSEYLRRVAEAPLQHEPGERFTYTSPGYFLLAVALENAAGKSYAELLEQHVATPLGLEDTFVANNLTVRPRLATGYMRGLGGLVQAPVEQESNRLGAGNIATTARDLYRFQRILRTGPGPVLTSASRTRLLQEQTARNAYVGRRFEFPHSEGRRVLTLISMGGSSYGFAARADRLVENDGVIIALSNVQDTDLTVIFENIGDLLLDHLDIDLGTTPSAEGQANPPDVTRPQWYSGVYDLGENGFVGVFEQRGRLYRQVSRPEHHGLLEPLDTRRLLRVDAERFDVEGLKGLQYRFAPAHGGSFEGYRIEVLRDDEVVSEGNPGVSGDPAALAEFEGRYHSVELQRTYEMRLQGANLLALSFLGHAEVSLTPVAADRFQFPGGHLVFHRDTTGGIRDFRLQTTSLDSAFGSLFIRR